MSTTNKKDKAEEYKIAEQDWNREIEILKLLARKRQISVIASQFNENDRQIRRIRDKAMNYPASLIVTLPLEIQDYLVKRNAKQRPELKAELYRIGKKQILDLHMEDLSITARKLAEHLQSYWPYTRLTDQTIAEAAVENDDRTLVSVLKSPEAEWLFAHMKEELPQRENLSSWKNLKVNDITDELVHRLSLRAARKEFPGECEACKDRE